MMKKLKTLDAACAVVALCYASKQDEEAVLRVATMHGFKPGEGMTDNQWIPAAKVLGLNMRALSFEHMELRKFIKQYPIGLYFVSTPQHLFVLDNGLIIDPRTDGQKLRRSVRQAWKIYT